MAGRTLTVMLAADTSRFRNGMRTAGRQADSFGDRVSRMSHSVRSMAGPALAAGAAAAGAFAIQMGVEGVKAAIDQEAKLASLDATLKKMGWGSQSDDAKKFMDELARITLYEDDELIKPLQDMALAIGGEDGLTKAMEVLPGLLDASTKSGKDLPSLIAAAAKAANGKTTALQKMFPWLKSNSTGTLTFEDAMRQLQERFEGGATEAANTFAGKIENAGKAFDELKEAFGVGFLEGLGNAEDAIGEEGMTGTLYDLQDEMKNFGKNIGDFLTTIGKIAGSASDIHKSFVAWRDALKDSPWASLFKAIESALNPLKTMVDGLVAGLLKVLELAGLARGVGTGQGTITSLGSLTPRPVNMGGGQQPSSWQNLSEQAIAGAVANALARGDARNGYVVGGVLR